MVLNSLKEKGAGFKHDSNKVSILTKDNTWKEFELKTKDEVAKDIWNTIYDLTKLTSFCPLLWLYNASAGIKLPGSSTFSASARI